MPSLIRYRTLPRLVASCLLALLTPAVLAAEQFFQLDPVHTRVMLAIDHAGFSKAIGTVSGSIGSLHLDPDDWSNARVHVSVPLHNLDLGDPGWNRAAQATKLLDVDRHPLATFTSTRVEALDAQQAAVYGMLTLRGVTREVKLEVRFNALKRHPLPPFRRTAGFSASTRISRADFGIDAWPSVIGDEVELRMEVEAVRARNAGDTELDAPAIPTSPPIPEPTP